MKNSIFLIVFFSLFSLSAEVTFAVSPSCGTSGSIRERILDCNTSRTSRRGFKWQLVTRTSNGEEVWRENLSKYLWSDCVNQTFDHGRALDACGEWISLAARGNLSFLRWSLPPIELYERADERGLREILPNMRGNRFWSSSLLPDDGESAWEFDGSTGERHRNARSFVNAIHCVTR